MATTSLRTETSKARGLAALAAIALAFALGLCLAPAFGQTAWADDEADAAGDEVVAVDEAVVEAAEAVEAEAPADEAVVEEEALESATIGPLSEGMAYIPSWAGGDMSLLDGSMVPNGINMNAYNAMITCFTNLSPTVDLSSFYIYKSDFEDLYWMMVYTRPDIFYVSGGTYHYESSGRVISFDVQYAYNTATIKNMRAQYENAALLGAGRCAIFTTQTERVHAAHDYIIRNVSWSAQNDIDSTAYGALVNGKANGLGYTLGLMAILNTMGMENGCVVSDSMDWVWNIVKVDGNWYHVDAGADDPDSGTKIDHVYFMKSDNAFRSNYDHNDYNWVTYPSNYYASSSQYDNESTYSKDNWKNKCPFTLDSSAFSYRNPYSDVHPRDWFYSGVTYCNRNSLMGGYSGTSLFGPADTMTRAMVVTVLYRIAGSPSVQGAMPFVDCDPSAYYAKAVVWASKNGITTGYTPTTFGPNDFVTREQFATFLFRYANYKGYNTSARANISSYWDAYMVSGYAYDAMSWANAKGIITGKGGTDLAPLGGAQRCEAATILMRFDKQY